MIHRPDISSLRALHVLAQQPGWKGFDELLTHELNAVNERLADSRDIPALHQLQGRAQLIKEIRKLVADAPGLLEKMER